MSIGEKLLSTLNKAKTLGYIVNITEVGDLIKVDFIIPNCESGFNPLAEESEMCDSLESVVKFIDYCIWNYDY